MLQDAFGLKSIAPFERSRTTGSRGREEPILSERLFARQFWKQSREFTLSWAVDLYRWLLLLVGLGFIFRVLKLGEAIGYDPDLLKILERVDFAFGLACVVLIGYIFVLKTLMEAREAWKKWKK